MSVKPRESGDKRKGRHRERTPTEEEVCDESEDAMRENDAEFSQDEDEKKWEIPRDLDRCTGTIEIPQKEKGMSLEMYRLKLEFQERQQEREREERQQEREREERQREREERQQEREKEREEREKERQHELRVLRERQGGSEWTTMADTARTFGLHSSERQDVVTFHAKRLRGVLEKMPAVNCEEQLPTWFRNAEKTFELYEVPEEYRGKLLLPMLDGKTRQLISHLSSSELADYNTLKVEILKAHKLSASEYGTKFRTAKKNEGETWRMYATRLQDIFDLYLESREAKDFGRLKQLMVADAFKSALRPEMKQYVLLQEGSKSFFTAPEIAVFCEKFDEAGEWSRDYRQQNVKGYAQRKDSSTNAHHFRYANPNPGTDSGVPRGKSIKDTHPKSLEPTKRGNWRMPRCWRCGSYDHKLNSCPSHDWDDKEKKLAGHESKDKPRRIHNVMCTENQTDTSEHEESVEESISRLLARVSMPLTDINNSDERKNSRDVRVISLQTEGREIQSVLDTGAEISVFSEKVVPECYKAARGKVRLMGAFGHEVKADLINMRLRMGKSETYVTITCAMTDQLSPGIEGLLSLEDYELMASMIVGDNEENEHDGENAIQVEKVERPYLTAEVNELEDVGHPEEVTTFRTEQRNSIRRNKSQMVDHGIPLVLQRDPRASVVNPAFENTITPPYYGRTLPLDVVPHAEISKSTFDKTYSEASNGTRKYEVLDRNYVTTMDGGASNGAHVYDTVGGTLLCTKDEEKKLKSQEKWLPGFGYYVTWICATLGIVNLWRFLSLVYENGGGAFIFAYVVAAIFMGIPMFILETAVGQFTGSRPTDAWRCIPLLKGLATGQLISGFYFIVHVLHVVGLSLLYCDASDFAIGASVAQTDAKGHERPVAFASKKLNTTQRRWAAIGRKTSYGGASARNVDERRRHLRAVLGTVKMKREHCVPMRMFHREPKKCKNSIWVSVKKKLKVLKVVYNRQKGSGSNGVGWKRLGRT